MNEKEEIFLVLIENPWFERGEIIYAENSGRDYITTRKSRKCDMGYFINGDKLRKISRKENPEYFL